MENKQRIDDAGIDFSAWLRMERARQGERQEDTARRIGVSTVTLRAWEQGTRPVKVSSLRALADWSGRATAHDLLTLLTC